jgi:hypothetical protein
MMRKNKLRDTFLVVISFFLLATFRLPLSVAQTPSVESLRSEIHFHARFDSGFDAKANNEIVKMFTAESPARKEKKDGMNKPGVAIVKAQGKYGDCIRFSEKSKEVLCYPGTAMHYQDADWSGTTSFWMRLNPDEDLKPGYCDPIQITQKAWNDACFFVDFDIALPRDFRLGFFSSLKHWNPENIPWEKWPVDKRPMVTVKKPAFSRANWTHVAFTYRNVNSSKGLPAEATLYLNGKPQGTLSYPMQVQWDLKQTAIMVGIDYIGDMDDLIVFRKALSPGEIQFLADLPSGL